MTAKDIQEFQNLENDVIECYEFFNKNKEKMNLDKFEQKLNSIKKTMIRNTAINILNIIDKVVETGEKTNEGTFKQFNVSSVQIGFEETILLVAREVLGIDRIDSKYILDTDVTFINFDDIRAIY